MGIFRSRIMASKCLGLTELSVYLKLWNSFMFFWTSLTAWSPFIAETISFEGWAFSKMLFMKFSWKGSSFATRILWLILCDCDAFWLSITELFDSYEWLCRDISPEKIFTLLILIWEFISLRLRYSLSICWCKGSFIFISVLIATLKVVPTPNLLST